MSFSPSLEDLRVAFDARLDRLLDDRRDALPEAGLLIDEIARVVRSGGKRLRPLFCYWGFRAAGGQHGEPIVAAAAALELLHTFAVIHDDIMDRAAYRRGEPTVHARHGQDVALLAGDLALVLADDGFLSSGFEPAVLLRGFEGYSRMRQRVIAGQYLDLDATAREEIDENAARRIAVMKSGGYSIEDPLAIGALLGGASEDLLDELVAFGRPLGEAFQMRDDLLGTFGDPGSVGKPVDSDVREGKRHVLFAKAIRSLQGAERDRFLALWGGGRRLSDEDVAEVRALLERCGAKLATERLLADLVERAQVALARIPLGGDVRSALERCMAVAVHRGA